jgi:hypothetical protein
MKRYANRTRWPVALTVLGVAALTAAVAAMAATARTATKPTGSSPPTISGTMSEGSTLTAANGSWNGTQPFTYKYQWLRCDANGGSCAGISGATQQTYVLKGVDDGNTLRVRVTASNSDGSASSTSVPTGVVAATPQPAATGCPKTGAGATVAVGDISSPARLQVDQFQTSPGVIPGDMTSFTLRVHVGDTCGQTVSGADVFATAVPYNQVTVPPETQTGGDGWVTLHFTRLDGFPAAKKQRLMVFFIRARKPGESPLAGITTSRLVSVHLNLHGI